jgi:hypothetical protein
MAVPLQGDVTAIQGQDPAVKMTFRAVALGLQPPAPAG